MQTKAQAAARNAPTGRHQFHKGESVPMDPSHVSTSTVQVQTDSSQKPDNHSESQGDVNQKPSSTMGLVSQERGVRQVLLEDEQTAAASRSFHRHLFLVWEHN
ncbi:hypothetical protein GIB67_041491 [Kingdonia uniflora]|uniref:Uncharacterized protein n=1 Tax=Kingdonia uniflora TaxID=39325 RepID=A0A7J7PAY5_9MAGN|nr:hypothetical protein GIB67_041491 [Kingdonia uniflora]